MTKYSLATIRKKASNVGYRVKKVFSIIIITMLYLQTITVKD